MDKAILEYLEAIKPYKYTTITLFICLLIFIELISIWAAGRKK